MKQLSDDEIAELLLEEEPLFRRIRAGKRPLEQTRSEQDHSDVETPTEAFKRGVSTGRQEAILVIGKRLLLRKCSVSIVQEITGLSTAQIKRLQSLIQSS